VSKNLVQGPVALNAAKGQTHTPALCGGMCALGTGLRTPAMPKNGTSEPSACWPTRPPDEFDLTSIKPALSSTAKDGMLHVR